MKRAATLALILCVAPLAAAQGAGLCGSLVEEQRQIGAGDDLWAAPGFDLLRGCDKRFCVVASQPDVHQPAKVRLVSADRIGRLAEGQQDQALMAVAWFESRKKGKVCVFARYSGGSAAAWIFQGRTADGRYETHDETSPPINGDSMRPSWLLEAMDDRQKRSRWWRVRKQ